MSSSTSSTTILVDSCGEKIVATYSVGLLSEAQARVRQFGSEHVYSPLSSFLKLQHLPRARSAWAVYLPAIHALILLHLVHRSRQQNISAISGGEDHKVRGKYTFSLSFASND
ncbi:hypothetical protein AC1031_020700 [Aphanomyces cochlioides]|nr:hypothetical protein AC1031_020700 [Aphanomyces cochlioides]